MSQVTELLYTKQTQLERMAGEKAAQQLAHERQIAQAKDDAERVKRFASNAVLPHEMVHAIHDTLQMASTQWTTPGAILLQAKNHTHRVKSFACCAQM